MLPKGWSKARVDELAGPNGLVTDGDWVESKDQDASGKVRLTQLADVGEGDFRDRSARFMTREAAERLRCTYLEPNDVLIARMPDPIGRACLFPNLGQPAVTAVDVMIWRTDGQVADADWFVHWVNSPAIRKAMAEGAGGTTRQRIAGGRIKEMELPVPPKGEQRRIVAKLLSLTAHLTRARQELDRIPANIGLYKQRLLILAAEGALTRDWREKNALPSWTDVAVEDVCLTTFDGPFGSNLKSSDYVESGVRVVRLENIGSLNFIREKESYISAEKYQLLKRHTLEPGDVLFSSFIAEEIRVCQFPSDLPTLAINKADCFCVRPDTTRCLSAFLTYRLASPTSYEELKRAVHGATRPRISLSHLKGYSFGLPSIEEQVEIVRRIECSFAWLDRVACDHAAATRLLLKLEGAILAKAFRGELVAQDSNDEPASVLLERIRAERAVQPKKARKRNQHSLKANPMTEKPLSARDRLLKDSKNWPKNGLPFAEVANRVTLPHDEMRDVLFELLGGPTPSLRQAFDKKRKLMVIQRIVA